MARLAREHDVDLLLVDAPDGLLEDARLLALLDHAPCDVGVVVGDGLRAPGPCSCRSRAPSTTGPLSSSAPGSPAPADASLRLAGATAGADGRDASRLLASASHRRAAGARRRRPSRCSSSPTRRRSSRQPARPASSSSASPTAGAARASDGRAPRWRRRRRHPTLLVRRGVRPGGLAPRDGGDAVHLDDRRLTGGYRAHGRRPGRRRRTPSSSRSACSRDRRRCRRRSGRRLRPRKRFGRGRALRAPEPGQVDRTRSPDGSGRTASRRARWATSPRRARRSALACVAADALERRGERLDAVAIADTIRPPTRAEATGRTS